MKQTQVIYLTFASGTSTTSAYVNVPFKVKTIHVKSMSLTSGDLAVVGGYITIESDMVNNQPVGTTFTNSSYSAGSIQDVELQYWNPQAIQGQYNFTMKRANGTFYPASTGGDKVALIIEFNDANEIL